MKLYDREKPREVSMMFIGILIFIIVYPVLLNYMAHVEPLGEQFAKLLEPEFPPVEAKAENIFSGFGVLHSGQFNSEPSAPMR